jgi:DNA repair exonuclease SbcCD nuclease subunit
MESSSLTNIPKRTTGYLVVGHIIPHTAMNILS